MLIPSKLKESQKRWTFTLVRQPTKNQLVTYYTLQFLDVYTTARGVRDSRVRELNPIYGEKPTPGKLLLGKSITTTYLFNANPTANDIQFMNNLLLMTVLNNLDVLESQNIKL